MKKNLLLLLACALFINAGAQQQNVSSMGTDFWTGMGFNTRMQDIDQAENVPLMSLFISAQQATRVRVSLQFPAPGFPGPCNCKIVNVPAGQAVEVTNFPMGDMADEYNETLAPDSRLYFTGITNRAIHIESLDGVPVSAYQYSYGKDVGASTVLFPTGTWGSSYIVSTKGGGTNAGLPNSFFFVMAQEDSTWVDIVPTEAIIDSSQKTVFNSNATPVANIKYQKGVPFSVLLYKGKVFNAMGALLGGRVGIDLSGTTVKARDCGKKITVFSGNGRVTVPAQASCASVASSDNLIVQLFPRSAWGTKYLTTPTTNTVAKYNLFRIIVADPATKVWVNNPAHTTPLTGVTNNFYELRTDQPSMIESDKPIMVTQFMLSPVGGCNDMGNTTPDEPEMIIISPVQQALNNISVFSPRKSRFLSNPTSTHYINVVIRKEGVASFRFDNLTTFNGTPITGLFQPHPQDANYSYAYFQNVTVGATGLTHNLKSDSGFNAIAYGLTQGETYGYNAGTAIKDLSAVISTLNPFDTIGGSKTCKGNAATVEIAVPYLASEINNIKWDAGSDSRISPANYLVNVANPVPVRTYISNDITYNVYRIPQALTFNAVDTFRINATISGTFVSECGSTQLIPIDMVVIQDSIDFSFSNANCASTLVTFVDKTKPFLGSTIETWHWDFGDNSSSDIQNPPAHNYSALLPYTVKLRTINDIGCFADTSKVIDFSAGVKAGFTLSPKDTICSGGTINFTDTSKSNGAAGAITKWTWNFGEGADVVLAASSPQSHTYNSPGVFYPTLQVETANGCPSTIFKDTIVIEATPVAAIDPLPSETCFGDSTAYKDKSTIAVGNIGSWLWTFDDGTTSTLQNPKHKWLTIGQHTVTLTVSSAGGCPGTNTATHTVTVNPLPVAGFTVTVDCTTKTVTFKDNSTAGAGNITEWAWDFGDGQTAVRTNGNDFTHVYTNSGVSYTVSLTVKTDNGCSSSTPFTQTFTIGATPAVDFDLPSANLCLPNASATFTNTTTISDGANAQISYQWIWGDGDTTKLPAPNTVNPSATSHTYTTVGPFNVKLAATSNNGCYAEKIKQLTTIYAQPTAVIGIAPGNETCIGEALNFSSNNSTAPNSSVTVWSWTFGDAQVSDQQAIAHTYAVAGPFNVSLTVTSAAGCASAAKDTVVTINQLPTADFTMAAAPCAGGNMAFIDNSNPVATGATLTEWHWDFGDGSPLVVLTSPGTSHVYPIAGTYIVKLWVKSSKGCTSTTTSHSVTVNALPQPDFTVSDICIPNGSALFNATNTGNTVVATWNWKFDDATTASGQQASHIYTTGGLLPVKLIAISADGCTDSVTKAVTAYNAPTAGLDIPNASGICSSDQVVLSNKSVVNGYGSVTKLEIFWDYANNPGAKITDNNPTPDATYSNKYPAFGSPATKTVQVLIRAYSTAGCFDDSLATITLNAAPQAQFIEPTPVCQEIAPFALTGGSDLSALPGEGIYTGNGITTSPEFSPALAGPGSHQLIYTYTTANGCSSADTAIMVVYPTPIVDYGGTRAVLEGDTLKLSPKVATGNGLTYLWTPADYLSNNSIKDPVTKPESDKIYVIDITSADGCELTDTLVVKMLKDFIVPNTFSPNNDGINDTWVISQLGLYPVHRIQIFNRYGQVLFETRNYQNAWDGTYKGKPLPFGTYYYIIDLDGWRDPKTGYVTILK